MGAKNYTPIWNALKNRKEGFLIDVREDPEIYTAGTELKTTTVFGSTTTTLKLSATDNYMADVELGIFESDELLSEFLLGLCNVRGVDTLTGDLAPLSEFTVDYSTITAGNNEAGEYVITFTWDGTEAVVVTAKVYVLKGTVDCENTLTYDAGMSTVDSNRACDKGNKSQTKVGKMHKLSTEIDYDANDEVLADRGWIGTQTGVEGTILVIAYHMPTLQRISGQHNVIINAMTMNNDELIKYAFDFTLYANLKIYKLNLLTRVIDYDANLV